MFNGFVTRNKLEEINLLDVSDSRYFKTWIKVGSHRDSEIWIECGQVIIRPTDKGTHEVEINSRDEDGEYTTIFRLVVVGLKMQAVMVDKSAYYGFLHPQEHEHTLAEHGIKIPGVENLDEIYPKVAGQRVEIIISHPYER